MQKSKLDRFISKYNLGGNVNSVKWKSDGNTLSTSFVTPDKSLLGTVKVDKFSFDSAELGIYQKRYISQAFFYTVTLVATGPLSLVSI